MTVKMDWTSRARRLLAKRSLSQEVDGFSKCWVWNGYIKPEGYGEVSVRGRKAYAHRVSYELFVGPIPAGHQIDHLCRVRSCINPGHLEAVTSRENTMRGENWSAKKAAQTHCVNGHEFTPGNTRIRKNGTRRCKTCEYDRCRKYQQRDGAWDVTEVRVAEPHGVSRA